MTVMENLHRKGWLRRERDGRAWRYEPTGSRSGYTAALMNDALGTTADRGTALAHFVLQMSPHDAALLQQALDQARGQAEEAECLSGRCCWRTRRASVRSGPGCSAGPGGQAGLRCWPSSPTWPPDGRSSPRSGWPA